VIEVPVRVDFAGGWLDVPQFALPGGTIVNCAVSPLLMHGANPYRYGGGVGGSAAYAILNGQDVRKQESAYGAGWQDEAVIQATGMCSWKAGPEPELLYQDSGEWLAGLMLIKWTTSSHDTKSLVSHFHDLQMIQEAGDLAYFAHQDKNLEALAQAIDLSYCAQIREGMKPLWREKSIARKYLGSGHGGYALYLYDSKTTRDQRAAKLVGRPGYSVVIEPYYNPTKD
jgi:hypothetical protein